MSALKLQQKLARREKYVKQNAADFDRIDKMNKEEETMADSPAVLKLARGAQRRLDSSFGKEALGKEPALAIRHLADLERFDFDAGAGTDFGIKLSMASTPAVAEETDITCVADVTSSLNDTYFIYNTPANSYYVWYNVNAAGTDPMVADKTGVEVAIAEDASADDVALATATAMDLLSDVSASSALAVVSAANDAGGAVTDAANGAASPGFSFNVTQQGADALGALIDTFGIIAGDYIKFLQGALKGKYLKVLEVINDAELKLEDVASFTTGSSIYFRALMSSEKKSYV